MLLMLVGAVAELVTIGAVIPFIALLADPERAYEFELLQRFFAALGWTEPEALKVPMTALFVVIVIISAALRLLLLWARKRFTFGLGYDIGVDLYGKVLHQPYDWHIARNTSQSIAAVNKVQMMVAGVLTPIMEAIIGGVTGLAIVLLLLFIEPLVAISAAVIFGFFYLVVVRLMRLRLRTNSKIIAKAQTDRIKAVQEGLGGIRDVLLDGNQSFYKKHYAGVDQRLRTAQAANAFVGAAPRFIIEPIGICLIVALAFFLANTPGGLIAALPTLGALALGAQRLLPLLQQLYNGWSRIMGHRQVFADVLEYSQLPVPQKQPHDQVAPIKFEDELRLSDLRFRYDGDGPWVIDGIDLVIPRGTRFGIAGVTGSGKTTLMDILMGLLDPIEGQMQVDGTPLDPNNRRRWQKLVAHVPQFIFLADASMAENIAFGMPSDCIDMEQVRLAARRAQIADFIEGRIGGYEARVGERGIQLSGGQRQRIGIARALYKNAEVLVFDEATSALDEETERAVMSAIESLSKDLTIILIAHRLSTLKTCDEIVILRDGRIENQGSYQDLFGVHVSIQENDLQDAKTASQ